MRERMKSISRKMRNRGTECSQKRKKTKRKVEGERERNTDKE